VVRAGGLVGDREAERARLPAQLAPLVADLAAHGVGGGAHRPVDAAVLEMRELAGIAGGVQRAGDRVAEAAAFRAETVPLVPDRAAHPVRAHVAAPEDGGIVGESLEAAAGRGVEFGTGGVTEHALTAHLVEL